MPQLAKLADKLTIVRSFQTNNADHNIKPIVGPDTLNANIGSLYSRVVGADAARHRHADQRRALPAGGLRRRDQGRSAAATSPPPARSAPVYAPFIPGARRPAAEEHAAEPAARPLRRPPRSCWPQFDRLQARLDADRQPATLDQLPASRRIELLLSGGVADALDLSQGRPAASSPATTPAATSGPTAGARSARGKRGYYTGHAKSLGKLLLLARRLCEAGCGFVTVHADYEGVWDMHADGNNLNMIDGMEAIGRPFDHAVAAFIEDVEARGLADKILLVCCGEMGRTPRLNKNGGRDHWAQAGPAAALRRRPAAAARSSANPPATAASRPPTTSTPKHLISTILHTVFDIGQAAAHPGAGVGGAAGRGGADQLSRARSKRTFRGHGVSGRA